MFEKVILTGFDGKRGNIRRWELIDAVIRVVTILYTLCKFPN